MIQRFCSNTISRTAQPGILQMASPRRSARISAAAQTALPEKPADVKRSTSSRAQQSGIRKPKTSVGVASKATKRKKTTAEEGAENAVPAAETEFKVPDHPATPKRQRTSTHQDEPAPPFPPVTPRRRNDATAPDLNRPVDPHHSTATLLTPHGSHVTAYPSNVEQASPSKTGLPRPNTTTGNILEHGLAHLLSVDSRLRHIIDKYPSPPFGPADLAEEVDPFRSLTSGIIGQQVSGAAAKSIKNKFIALFNNTNNINNTAQDAATNNGEYDYNDSANPSFPTPEQVAKFDIATLRTAGLSQRKAEYIQGLAEKFASGELSARMLLTASDEDVLAKLIAVRGLGQWSVEMFSCFGLKRLDVFSTGDLGVQRGMAAFVGRDVGKLKAKGGGKFKYMSEKDMLEISAPFSPYRSLFMWYMWRWEEVDVSVMQ